eukprot:190025-Heterocapsa_arctica.AAC.1
MPSLGQLASHWRAMCIAPRASQARRGRREAAPLASSSHRGSAREGTSARSSITRGATQSTRPRPSGGLREPDRSAVGGLGWGR